MISSGAMFSRQVAHGLKANGGPHRPDFAVNYREELVDFMTCVPAPWIIKPALTLQQLDAQWKKPEDL